MMKKMDNPTVTVRFPNNRPHSPYIGNLEELKATRKVVKQRVLADEAVLKERLQELPGQLLYTGVKNILPPLLKGSVTNTVLGAGKALIDHFFIKKHEPSIEPSKGIPDSLKRAGLLTAIRWGLRLALRAI
ncbi:MAG TPA: hypothetical protein VL547_09135 [Dinghuibacter sp.]|jgi:hypothetical protein|uniref:hypothetical protein n=1 Tax=Dinghuibacter sp. TaxID=2024697 RepID=UPI002D0D7E86|nr:hypothetical protein [Dinghuibacter sp.]HTJ12177.1 hypothetical protein [Dinghuibacter sp.]